jgi:glycosyltransferase involved in cell wall biosynthesis
MGLLPTRRKRRIFVSWGKHSTRSASLGAALGCECHYFDRPLRLGPLKSVPALLRTIALLFRRRPALVACMNPPYFNGLVAWGYTLLFRARFVLDSHTAAFDDPRQAWLAPLHAFLVRRAATSFVTNRGLASAVERMGGRALVVSDIPYEMPPGDYSVAADRFAICYVCTYGRDEPVDEVLRAADSLPDVRIYVTGDLRRAPAAIRTAAPENVTLTGYLSNAEYAGLLRGVAAILVMTTRPLTMQRGGSEAITVGKPLIVSNTETLQEIFSSGAVFIENTAAGIIEGVRRLRRDYERYRRGIEAMAATRAERWATARGEIEALLD